MTMATSAQRTDRLSDLCKRATLETDSRKLIVLFGEINSILSAILGDVQNVLERAQARFVI